MGKKLRTIKIKKGIDIPISGQPEQKIEAGRACRTVALLGADYIGMKPTMAVEEGDTVKLGQLLFTDKKNEGVRFCSPGAGKVTSLLRGAKRVFLGIIVELAGDEEEKFNSYKSEEIISLSREQVVEDLNSAGMWTSFRTRPYSKSPALDAVPHSIFVRAIDTNPLAANPSVVLENAVPDLITGLKVIQKLTEGQVHFCQSSDLSVDLSEVSEVSVSNFDGPHPAGLSGTHIHYLDPVSDKKNVWTIGYQDVVAIGRLFSNGRLDIERVISIAGPSVTNPQLVRTRLGAKISDLTIGNLQPEENRVISGSVLNGVKVEDPLDYIGRFHEQVTVIQEGNQREFLGWMTPGFKRFSVKNTFASAYFGATQFKFTSSKEGSDRAMVPVGSYESVMPLDVLPTYLLRALIVKDTEQAQALGCLELVEEDVALCTFVCPSKYEYGPILRDCLNQIEKDG
jgi:Na+-transporting NADH:ubiquinone oxidoreductase subunit A